jgi:hypothetical protein
MGRNLLEKMDGINQPAGGGFVQIYFSFHLEIDSVKKLPLS